MVNMIFKTFYNGKLNDFSLNADVIKLNFVPNKNYRNEHSVSRNVFYFLKNL